MLDKAFCFFFFDPCFQMASSSAHPMPMPWDRPQSEDWDSSDDDTPESNPGRAALELLDIVVGLYTSSQISAANLCILCYYADLCGMSHAAELAQAPGKSSGNYQRFLNKALGYDHVKKNFYQFKIPGAQYQGEAGRRILSMPIRPPHETADMMMAESQHPELRLREAKEAGRLPEAYYSNPVVQAFPDEPVYPWGLYLDAVPYSKVDTSLGVWLIDLLTGQRKYASRCARSWLVRVDVGAGARGGCCLTFFVGVFNVWGISFFHQPDTMGPHFRRLMVSGQQKRVAKFGAEGCVCSSKEIGKNTAVVLDTQHGNQVRDRAFVVRPIPNPYMMFRVCLLYSLHGTQIRTRIMFWLARGARCGWTCARRKIAKGCWTFCFSIGGRADLMEEH